MPGLAFKGPFLVKPEPNFVAHNDFYLPEVTDFNWDVLNLPHLHFPQVGALPLVPNRHKACWPTQSQPTWMQNLKEEAHAKLLENEKASNQGLAHVHGSSDSEHDLAAMVHDFMENDSCDIWEASESDNGASSVAKFCDRLQVLTSSFAVLERGLLSNVTMLLLAINEDTDLIHSSEASECKGSCTRRFVVKHLRSAGYNAALCKSRWHNSGKVPGGEYEYIDVVYDGDRASKDRLIVDVDFQAQFEIARPTDLYVAALKSLPTVFVGTTDNLEQVLEIMSEAAKCSLRQNCMHLPPWRTLDYMSAKWLSPFERRTGDFPLALRKLPCSLHWRSAVQQPASAVVTKACGEQLRRTKVSLLAEVKGSNLASLNHHGKGRANLLRKRISNW